MSPKSLSFIQYLKKMSGINFGQMVMNQKAMMNKTTGFVKIPQNEQLAPSSFMIQSKDKRHQLHASDVKQYIMEANGLKTMSHTQKRQTQSITSEMTGSVQTYNAGSQHLAMSQLNNTMPVGSLTPHDMAEANQGSLDTN